MNLYQASYHFPIIFLERCLQCILSLKLIKIYLTVPIFLLIVLFALPTSAFTLPVLLEQNTTLVPLSLLSETLGYTLNFTGNKNPIL